MVPNFKYPRLSDARIVILNDTVPKGSRADEGNLIFVHHVLNLVLDRVQSGRVQHPAYVHQS